MSGKLESIPLFAKKIFVQKKNALVQMTSYIRVCMKRLMLRGQEKKGIFSSYVTIKFYIDFLILFM